MASRFIEGHIQSYRGYLSRKTGIFRTWERVEMEVKKLTHQQWIFFQVPENTSSDPSYHVKFKCCYVMPCDPRKAKSVKEFLSIFIKFDDKSEIHHFLAEDVAEQRGWMIALGAKGHGLFSEDCGHGSEPLESWIGKWDQIHPSLDSGQSRAETRGRADGASNTSDEALPPAYDNVIGSMVSSIEQAMVIHQMEHLNISAETPTLPPPCFSRRPMDDTFLPPYGPKMNRPYSVGFGAEIKLPDDFQQIFDPSIEKFVYINHETKNVSWADPRPPEPPPYVVDKKVVFYGDQRSHFATNRQPYLEALSDITGINQLYRFGKKKPVGLVIEANGELGQPGQDMSRNQSGKGATGRMGVNAIHRGHDGEPGVKGGRGSQGIGGGDGYPGTNASDLTLSLSGDPHNLHIAGDINVTEAYLGDEETEHVVYVSCRGGDGGRGGAGGKGGIGGQGGRGGNGAKGKRKYGKNQRGGSGGNGGHGGQGGDGGRGGPGGRGAPPGSGGNVDIVAYDARLLMLCEVDARSGDGGDGGCAGRGGQGGPGGPGGIGMKGGNGSGGRGRHGDSGRVGPTGNNGALGASGRGNDVKKCGSILWRVIDPVSGDTLHLAGKRYDLQICEVQVSSEINDHINEPNERIFISFITVMNNGDMLCPAGATITVMNSDTVNFVPKSVLIPEIPAHEGIMVTDSFTARVKDTPSPNTIGCYRGKAEIIARVHMLNRTFFNGIYKKTIDVQYPVKLKSIGVPAQMGRGEEKTIDIHIANISSMPYGEGPDSGGFVDVRVRLDRRLLPVPKQVENQPYIFSFDPSQVDSVCCKVLRIEPGSSWVLSLPVYLDDKAELYDKCLVEVDVYLRGKLIEYNHAFIRICPYFMNLDPPADILFVTGPELDRKAFTLWQTMFDWLNITLDFWDAERYNGFSCELDTLERHHEDRNVATWVDKFRGRTILCSKLRLSDFQPQDIKSHFFDRDGSDQHSALIFMPDGRGWDNVKNSVYTMNYHLVESEFTVDIGDKFSGKHLFKPSSDDTDTALGRIQEIIKKLEKEDPSHSYVLYYKTVNYEKTSTMKYSYGDAYIKRIPLKHSAGLFMTVNQNLHVFHEDNRRLSPMTREVPIGCNFAQVMLLFILTAPPKVRTSMIQSQKRADRILLVSPTGVEYTIFSLLGMALEPYICFEVNSLPKDKFKTLKHPVRLEAIVDEVCEHPNVYCDDTTALHAHLAAQSYIGDIKQCTEICQQTAAELYDKMKLALSDVTGTDKQVDLEKEAKHILKDKDRVTFNVLLSDTLYICPHRFCYKDKMYNMDRALARTRQMRHASHTVAEV